MKCANCNREALYVYEVAPTTPIFYCSKDLPSFLEARRKAGLLKTTEEHSKALASALKKTATKKSKPKESEEPEEPKEPKEPEELTDTEE